MPDQQKDPTPSTAPSAPASIPPGKRPTQPDPPQDAQQPKAQQETPTVVKAASPPTAEAKQPAKPTNLLDALPTTAASVAVEPDVESNAKSNAAPVTVRRETITNVVPDRSGPLLPRSAASSEADDALDDLTVPEIKHLRPGPALDLPEQDDALPNWPDLLAAPRDDAELAEPFTPAATPAAAPASPAAHAQNELFAASFADDLPAPPALPSPTATPTRPQTRDFHLPALDVALLKRRLTLLANRHFTLPPKVTLPRWPYLLLLCCLFSFGVYLQGPLLRETLYRWHWLKQSHKPKEEEVVNLDRRLQAIYQQGLAAYQHKNYGAAQEAFETLLSLSPKLPEAHRSLAVVCATLGQRQKAASHYQTYLKLKPNAQDANEVRKIIKDYSDEQASAREKFKAPEPPSKGKASKGKGLLKGH